MGFVDEGFKEFSKTSGKIRLEAEGKVDEKDYRSANYINSAKTIGYSAAEVEGKVEHIFISRTGKGLVLTMPGEQTGPVPFPLEGYVAVMTVKYESPVVSCYAAHIQALAGEAPLADAAWLEKEVPVLPQRALDVIMKVFEIACSDMEKIMEGMGKAMGEVAEGMGKAMGEMVEGVGKAVGEAMGEAAEGMGKAMGEGVEAAKEAPGEPAEGAAEEAAKGAKEEEAPPKKKAGKDQAPKKKAPPARNAKASKEPKKGPSGPKKKKK